MLTMCEILPFDNVNEGIVKVESDSKLDLKFGQEALMAEQSKDPSQACCTFCRGLVYRGSLSIQ